MNNVISDNSSLSTTTSYASIKIDAKTNAKLMNNVIYNNKNLYGIDFKDGFESYKNYLNNIAYLNSKGDFYFGTATNKNTEIQYIKDNNKIIDPQFVSMADYHFKSTSEAIDIGSMDIFDYTSYDLDNNLRDSKPDIGVYEYIKRPDLTITNVGVDYSGYIYFTMKNIGTADVSSSINGSTTINIDGQSYTSYSWSNTDKNFYKVNGYSTYITSFKLPNGTYYVTADIDSSKLVTESDEKNNSLGKSLTGIKLLPDLYVSDAWVDSNGYVYFTIKNGGEGDVYNTNGITSVSIDSQSPVSYSWSNTDKNFFKAGGTTTVKTTTKLSTGIHNVFIEVDSSKLVTESDENNNTLNKSIVKKRK
jgi:hypothetical protein